MDVEVNWLAVVLATLSTMVVGSVWYSLKVFGKKWEKLARIDPKHKANAGKAIGITLVVSLISAYVLAHVTYLSNSFLAIHICAMRSLQPFGYGWALRPAALLPTTPLRTAPGN